MEYFHQHGCRACDHGIERLAYAPATHEQIDAILVKRLRGAPVTVEEAGQYSYAIISFFAKEYAFYGWVMQLHLGVTRNVNTAMFAKLGPDSGFDCVTPERGLSGLAEFFNKLNSTGILPKTIVFSADPACDAAINTLTGCFQKEGIKGALQQGSAWWFNDTCTGMERQIISLAETGVLGNFIGMLTDSRSFLSYTRHEYFRRLLCSILGRWVDNGLYPSDTGHLGRLVEDICYYNVKDFFNF